MNESELTSTDRERITQAVADRRASLWKLPAIALLFAVICGSMIAAHRLGGFFVPCALGALFVVFMQNDIKRLEQEAVQGRKIAAHGRVVMIKSNLCIRTDDNVLMPLESYCGSHAPETRGTLEYLPGSKVVLSFRPDR